jgi:V-type H+-transporting ATPase subunit E
MIAFIQQEAAEKVEEVEAKAEEEFNIEKSRLVSQQRVKIIDYYDKKEKQIELQRKIQHSNLANASRLSILKARDDYVQGLKEEARKQLSILTQDQTKYKTILGNLIAQGLFLLMEKEVTLRCRRNDSALVQQLIPEAVNRYKQEFKQKDIKISVDDKNFLPDDSFVFDFIFFRINFSNFFLELVVLNFMQWVEKSRCQIQLKLDF